MPSTDSVFVPRTDVPLAPLCTLGIGGCARWFTRASTVEEVTAAQHWSHDRQVPLVVIGGGSNLVVADSGVEALVLQVAIPGVDLSSHGDDVVLHAGAGEVWDDVVATAVAHGLAGLECLSGIPGSAGGTPVQNVGAYGQEVADTLEAVTVLDRHSARLETLPAGECGFGYRTSRFKREDAGRFVVCGVSFRLGRGPATITYPDVVRHLREVRASSTGVQDVREAVLAVRRRKGMVLDAADPDTRSVGSFFMNPVVSADRHARMSAECADCPMPGFALTSGQVKIPAAWLIEQAGFSRGDAHGRAGLSSKHPLAIVNRGGATARDVVELAVRVKRAVGERFGVWLAPEPVFVGFDDSRDIDFLRRADGP